MGIAVLFNATVDLNDILVVGKRKSGQVEDGQPDPNHPPVSTSGFAKFVGKLHKSDDRGFMIQYNVRIAFQLFTFR